MHFPLLLSHQDVVVENAAEDQLGVTAVDER
jgi:hypothetical protein